MWSIDGVEVRLRLNGELLIKVESDKKRSLIARLLDRILSQGDVDIEHVWIVIARGKFLFSLASSRTPKCQVYIPYSRGKSFYGLYIDHDDGNLVLMLMGDSTNIGQQGEIEILDSLEKLDY